MEYFRSERSFAARLACIIQRSGIKVRHVQSTLTKAELTAQRVATKGAKTEVTWEEAVLIADNVEDAVASLLLPKQRAFRLMTEEELAGQQGPCMSVAVCLLPVSVDFILCLFLNPLLSAQIMTLYLH